MLTAISALALAAAGSGVLWLKARRDHHDALAHRAALLDDARTLFPDARLAIGADGFPSLSFRLADGRDARLVLIADSLVTRRFAAALARADDPRRVPATPASRSARWPGRPAPNSIPRFIRCRISSSRRTATCRCWCVLRRCPGISRRKAAARWRCPSPIRVSRRRCFRRAASASSARPARATAAPTSLRQARFDAPTVPADLVEQAIADALALEDAFARLAPARAIPA